VVLAPLDAHRIEVRCTDRDAGDRGGTWRVLAGALGRRGLL